MLDWTVPTEQPAAIADLQIRPSNAVEAWRQTASKQAEQPTEVPDSSSND